MKIRTWMVVLLGVTVQASMLAQTASLSSGTMDKVKMWVPDGDTFKEARVVIHFQADGLTIHSTKGGRDELLKRLSYAEIEKADYSVHGGALPGLGFLGKGPRRQLIIRCRNATTVLRLHKSNHKQVCREFTRLSGVRVGTSSSTSRGSFHWPAAI